MGRKLVMRAPVFEGASIHRGFAILSKDDDFAGISVSFGAPLAAGSVREPAEATI